MIGRRDDGSLYIADLFGLANDVVFAGLQPQPQLPLGYGGHQHGQLFSNVNKTP
jgi:hypothetical protein